MRSMLEGKMGTTAISAEERVRIRCRLFYLENTPIARLKS